jgi:hypothetical protein
MNWGTKITVLYLSFVGLILALAFVCFGESVELETADYYAKELKFQDQLDATNNANNLEVQVSHIVRDRSIQLIFPTELLSKDFSGTAYFMRPSNSSQDKTIPLSPGEEGIQMIDPGFTRGVYKMQISFTSNGKSYYKEDIINFQK